VDYRIELFPATKFIGKRVKMSLAVNRTQELWQSFMPQMGQIQNRSSSELFSVEIYDDTSFFEHFSPDKMFQKWAAVPVTHLDFIPNAMELLEIPKGLYAVFPYKGKASEAPKAYAYIFGTWIPNSDYLLDRRPHFAIMGEKYKNEDPDSEEELWIPIQRR
jgi:AraC family transcriptional regulator